MTREQSDRRWREALGMNEKTDWMDSISSLQNIIFISLNLLLCHEDCGERAVM